MKNPIATLSVFIILIPLLFSPTPAIADVAPPPIPIVGGIGTFNYQSTNVQMVSERVEMELTPYERIDEEYPKYNTIRQGVAVNAWFIMHNTSNKDETMQVVFPLKDLNECPVEGSLGGFLSYSSFYLDPATFKAQLNGTFVETKTITTDHPWKEKCLYKYSEIKMDWAAFEVNFPANEDTLIRVSYILDGGGDFVTNVGYTLETGAAWKGPIGEAIIVFRFPYVVENFIMPGTTSGYQTMQNEIYWRYENFEPTHNDNINVAFISPDTWAKIRESRSQLRNNPKNDAAWAALADSYSGIAHWHGPNIRSPEYDQRAYATYREGLKTNPFSAALNAGYADLYLMDCCYYTPISDADLKSVWPFIETALRVDPSNKTANELLDRLNYDYPEKDFVVGPTFTPNPVFTSTITITPFNTFTPQRTRTRTVTNTPIPTQAPTNTFTSPPPSTTVTPKIVSTAVQGEKITSQSKNGNGWIIGVLIVTVGFVIVIIWQQMKRRV
jgi:hypothetical protein